MASRDLNDDSLVLSYLAVRQAIGYVGAALPFVLAFGALGLGDSGIQSSVSSYYYTRMGDVFVGSLCVIGVFLLTYRGYEWQDAVASNIAAACAVGVALFPTAPANPTTTELWVGRLHLACAAILFAALAYFCLALFRKTKPGRPPTDRKLTRNRVYTCCGYTIIACIVLITIVFQVSNESLKQLDPVFWLEAVAIFAFGVSWLTKGEAILADL